MSVRKEHLSPPGLFSTRGLGFTHVVTSAPGKTIHVSGQTAWNAERKLDRRRRPGPADGPGAANLRTALEAAGATPADVVVVRLFVVNYRPEHAAVIGPALDKFFAGSPAPASTWLGVQALAAPGFLIEIEATAVVAG